MTIQFRCRNAECGKLLTVSEGMLGKKAKCPKCGEVQLVPVEADARSAPPARREERRGQGNERPSRRSDQTTDPTANAARTTMTAPGAAGGTKKKITSRAVLPKGKG